MPLVHTDESSACLVIVAPVWAWPGLLRLRNSSQSHPVEIDWHGHSRACMLQVASKLQLANLNCRVSGWHGHLQGCMLQVVLQCPVLLTAQLPSWRKRICSACHRMCQARLSLQCSTHAHICLPNLRNFLNTCLAQQVVIIHYVTHIVLYACVSCACLATERWNL